MKNIPIPAMAFVLMSSLAFASPYSTTTPTSSSPSNSSAMTPSTSDSSTPGSSSMRSTTSSGKFLTSIDSNFWLGSKVIGMPVYTSSTNEKIGDVSNIVIEPNGQIAALVVGIGGFLGVGERDVALRFAEFKPSTDSHGNMQLTLDMTKDQLKQVPEIKLPSGNANKTQY